MSTVTTSALQAYKNAANIADLPGLSGAQEAQAPTFSSLVKDAMSEAETIGKSAEATSAAHLAGKGELIDVVTALTAAQASLETVVAVRDKVISAYQEISRMAI